MPNSKISIHSENGIIYKTRAKNLNFICILCDSENKEYLSPLTFKHHSQQVPKSEHFQILASLVSANQILKMFYRSVRTIHGDPSQRGLIRHKRSIANSELRNRRSYASQCDSMDYSEVPLKKLDLTSTPHLPELNASETRSTDKWLMNRNRIL